MVVATEVAEQEFERFIDAMDLDGDVAGMAEADEKAFAGHRKIIVRAIGGGHLVVNENGEPVYTPRAGVTEPITFFEPTGSSLMAMDSTREGKSMTKMFATMSDATRQTSARFAAMKMRDLKVCQAVILLFLG